MRWVLGLINGSQTLSSVKRGEPRESARQMLARVKYRRRPKPCLFVRRHGALAIAKDRIRYSGDSRIASRLRLLIRASLVESSRVYGIISRQRNIARNRTCN